MYGITRHLIGTLLPKNVPNYLHSKNFEIHKSESKKDFSKNFLRQVREVLNIYLG